MQVSDFSNEKLFVLIKNYADVIAFVDPWNDNPYRNAAIESGVLVFLEPIHKIFAMGEYYGVDNWDEYVEKVNNLETSVQEIKENLTALGTQVEINKNNIGYLPYIDPDTGETIPGQGLLNDVANNTADILTLQEEVAALSPSGTSLIEIVNDVVDAKMATVLDDYVTLETFNRELTAKVDQTEFNSYKVNVANTLDEIEGTVGTNTAAISALQTIVTQIPKFAIKVVDELPPAQVMEDGHLVWNLYDEVKRPNGISTTTIYLKKRDAGQQSQNEVFTEYVFVAETIAETTTYSWEKLGSQFFNIENYYTIEETNAAIATGINTLAQSVAANATGIYALQTLLYTVDEHQNKIWNFTGDDIKTHANGVSTIGEDITLLQQSLKWSVED